MAACTHANGCCQRHPQHRSCAKRPRGHRQSATAAAAHTVYHDEGAPIPAEHAFWLGKGGAAQRSSALATHRSVADGDGYPVASTSRTDSCTASLVMLENRPLHNASSYWTKVIALNYLYATRHGYGFHLLAPSRSGSAAKGVYYSWCKVQTLQNLVDRLVLHNTVLAPTADKKCTWLVFLDSDAYIREQLTSVPQLLRSLGPAAKGAHLVLGRESPRRGKDWVFSTGFALNTGVLFLKASNFSRQMLRGWGSLEHTACQGKLFRRQAEQKCFERLLADQRHLLPAKAEEKIVHVPMQHFNSPWGRYARHIWGGEGAQLRATVYDDELKVQGIWTKAQQMALVEGARRVGSARTC